jgi:hypothetical protein
MERLIEHGYDFNKWKNDEDPRGKVTLATNENCYKLDAEEFFDHAVPTITLQKFMDLTPTEIASHQFCDLRLLAVLDKLSAMEAQSSDATAWLLAHCKITMDSKRRTFDNHGRWVGAGVGHTADQSSMGASNFTPCDADAELASRHCAVSPRQVAMCRGHVESSVTQDHGWNEVSLKKFERAKVDELNNLHGDGFGVEMWSQSCDKFGSMFTSDLLEKNRCAW